MEALEYYRDYPGYELVSKGIRDLENGTVSQESILVEIASHNLSAAGLLEQPTRRREPELALYHYLSERISDAHYQYKALTDRLVKFEQALLLNQAQSHQV